jgi:branched-subunit amino acid aminotransferase/4-amino-4-deoxychorismate lyase
VDFLVYDQKFYSASDLNVSHLFLNYNFQLEQRIFYINNELPLFRENIDLLKEMSGFFALAWPAYMENLRELIRITKRLLNKNRYYRTGIVVFRLIWDGDNVHCLIRALPSEEKSFTLWQPGILINFSETRKAITGRFAAYDLFNKLYWDNEVSILKGTPCSNSIIFNQEGYICEALGANIFFLKGNSIITPSSETGCYIDLIRNKILEAAVGINYRVTESERILKEQVFGMDEVFIASEANGMQWVKGIETKRYIYSKTLELNSKLNEILKMSV